LDCRRTLEVDERRELPGRTASMTLLRVKGMVEEMEVSGKEEGEEVRVREESELSCLSKTGMRPSALYL
jgi:hypothetical protein